MIDETIAERVRPLAAAFHDGGYARLNVRDREFEIEFRRSLAPATAVAAADAAAEPADARPLDAILADVVGIIRFLHPAVAETLGIRNAVRSRGAGRIAAVYVTDGQPVEYGQPLFAIER
jgi:multidrug efflux pump subunit AcrA (membrane-fusion protein)